MSSTRRTLLKAGALGFTALTSNTSIAERNPRQQIKSTSQLFDFSNPVDNLTAMVKVMGDLSGKATWLSAQGRIYNIQESVMPRPIVNVEGLRRLKFLKNETGYRMFTRDWVIFRDVETNQVIDEFKNPYTGKTNRVSHILTKNISWDMTPEKGQQMPSYTGEAYLIDRPLILPWVQEGNDVTFTLELLVKYSNGFAGGEWENILTNVDELNDPMRTTTSARQAWTGFSPWLRWMDMGDIPGRTLWQSSGRKYFSAEELRPELISAINTYYPGSLEQPENYKKS